MFKFVNLRTISLIYIIFILTGVKQVVLAEEFDDRVIKHIQYPSWFIESPFFDLSENIKQAKEKGKQGLMVVFGTEGCSYCDRFIQKSLHDPIISSLIRKNFDSLSLEVFDDVGMVDPQGKSMPVKEFAKQQGVQFSPSIIFYDTDGKRILKLVGYQSPQRFTSVMTFLTQGHYKEESLREYFAKHKSSNVNKKANAQLNKDKIFSHPPYILESVKKPLLVLFEKRACAECDIFHTEVLALKEVRNVLKKFKVVQLDVDDTRSAILTPTGNRLTSAGWYKKAGFSRTPAILFFDDKGVQVLKTDALVRRLRMVNSMNYVLEGAYKKGWTFQRYGRAIGREKAQQKRKAVVIEKTLL